MLPRPEDAKRHTLLDISADVPLFKYWKDALRLWQTRGREVQTRHGIAFYGFVEISGGPSSDEYLFRHDLKSGRLRRLFPGIEPLHDYFRLVFRIDDPRRPVFEGLARSLMEKPLR
jgi:hypothetical protein